MDCQYKCMACGCMFVAETTQRGFDVSFCPYCGTRGYVSEIKPYAPTNAGTVVVKGTKGF